MHPGDKLPQFDNELRRHRYDCELNVAVMVELPFSPKLPFESRVGYRQTTSGEMIGECSFSSPREPTDESRKCSFGGNPLQASPLGCS